MLYRLNVCRPSGFQPKDMDHSDNHISRVASLSFAQHSYFGRLLILKFKHSNQTAAVTRRKKIAKSLNLNERSMFFSGKPFGQQTFAWPSIKRDFSAKKTRAIVYQPNVDS